MVGEEYTVDELAARAQMTVRNVRAYAGRGLIDAPRLEGRTGYYNREHLQRLQLRLLCHSCYLQPPLTCRRINQNGAAYLLVAKWRCS